MTSKDITLPLTGVEATATANRLAAKKSTKRGRRSDGKHELEVIEGHEFNVQGHLMRKTRVIDRKNDRYVETVVDEDTGETVRSVDEPLSEHVARGSAKPR